MELSAQGSYPGSRISGCRVQSKGRHAAFDKFRETGMQIIVKMVSIEPIPEKPDFPVEPWHVCGPKRSLDDRPLTACRSKVRRMNESARQHSTVSIARMSHGAPFRFACRLDDYVP